ncbi:MAG: transcriptional regulator [Gammaproteobacteria bacterium]|jgi:DNA-binding HxlR family transcriptional regulator|nr:transcriptional regulator [Gammaproteobacteria bacterium]MCH1549934.1 transcriptional regulator [Pseudomonadales bacterium]
MGKSPNLSASDINELIHGKVRLAAIAYISGAGEADFTSIKKVVDTSDGNLSVHLRKLEEAGYVTVTKTFNARKPQTIYALSDSGRNAWLEYLEQMRALVMRN